MYASYLMLRGSINNFVSCTDGVKRKMIVHNNIQLKFILIVRHCKYNKLYYKMLCMNYFSIIDKLNLDIDWYILHRVHKL